VIAIAEFCVQARIGRDTVDAWIASGWLAPPPAEPEAAFSDVDMARARLIRELRDDLGVNDEGIGLILHLLDQVHGLRWSVAQLLAELQRRGDPR
jgi:chaperone modulatory protein CbpM